MQKVQGWAERGNTTVYTSSLPSVTKVQGSFPLCDVLVTLHGTGGTHATIYSDDNNAPTPLANPFTASADGSFGFYVGNVRIDITFSGGGLAAPITLFDITSQGSTGIPSYTVANLPTSKTQNAGNLARVTNLNRGIWMDTGTQWFPTNDTVINPLEFGAKFDGATDDTAALTVALAIGLPIQLPAGVSIITALELPTNCVLTGCGKGQTEFKAKANSVSNYLLHVPNTSVNVTLKNLTVNGNRANAGMVNAFSAPVYIEGSRTSVVDCEIKGGTWAGVWVGSTTTVRSTRIWSCYIHDNGGVVNNAGLGVGVLSGGAVVPEDIQIMDCDIESNYNTITRPNDSSGINLTVLGCTIIANRLRDNFNVNGGQIVVNGFVDQTSTVDARISDNRIISTTTFGAPADRTCGIEVQGRGFEIIGNGITLQNANALGVDGIQIGGDATHASGYGTIIGNTINIVSGVSTGINLDAAGLSSGITNVTVVGNVVKNASIGVNTQAAVDSLINSNNFTTCGQPQAGTVTSTCLMNGNLPYGVVTNSANGRVHTDAATVVAANDLTLGNSNANEVTGNTQINRISKVGWVVGDVVTLYFTGTPTVKNLQASAGNFIIIRMPADFVATANDELQLQFTGTAWQYVPGNNG